MSSLKYIDSCERRKTMNWDNFMNVWEEFLAFMDRAFQWLQFVFGVKDKWPPDDYEDFNDGKTE